MKNNSHYDKIKIVYIDHNNNVREIDVETIDKELGNTELSDLLKDDNISSEDKKELINKILIQYFNKIYTDIYKVETHKISNPQKRVLGRKKFDIYYDRYIEYNIHIPFTDDYYTLNILGKDMSLIKKLAIIAFVESFYYDYNSIFHLTENQIGLFVCDIITLIAIVLLVKAMKRILEISKEDS